MAGGKLTTLECMECGYREVFTERQFKTADGLSCYKCNGPVKPSITKPREKVNNRRVKKRMAEPLLVIELDKINSVPKVFYKGEEITNKVRVGFDWATKSDMTVYGYPYIDIEHFVNNGKEPYAKSIRYNGYFREGDSNV